jgi:hypothetical protein
LKYQFSPVKLFDLVKAKLIQHDKANQNGTLISKEKSSEDIEVIMLSKQVRNEIFLNNFDHKIFFSQFLNVNEKQRVMKTSGIK